MMMAQSIAALALVLAVFAGVVWLMKRFQNKVVPAKEGQMQVVQRLHLDSKNSVVEIRHGKQHYLIGVHANGMQRIADVTPEKVTAESEHAA